MFIMFSAQMTPHSEEFKHFCRRGVCLVICVFLHKYCYLFVLYSLFSFHYLLEAVEYILTYTDSLPTEGRKLLFHFEEH
jgi:hypothetical protein